MKYFFLFFCVSMLLVGCAKQIPFDETIDYRVDVLYAHTEQMELYAEKKTLDALGLDMSHFRVNSQLLTTEEKITILGKSYNTSSRNITYLENRMTQMMDEWVELQDIS